MKKVILAIILALFSVTAIGTAPGNHSAVFAQKKNDDKKKDTPGPPVVRDKGKDERPKEPPKKDKRPD